MVRNGEIVFREWICEMQSERPYELVKVSSGCRVLTLQRYDIDRDCKDDKESKNHLVRIGFRENDIRLFGDNFILYFILTF